MAFDFPSSPSVGDQFVAPSGILYLYDNNSSWSTLADTQSPNPFTNNYKYRTIYTRGYVGAGYKNSSPWRNVNRTAHTTDITTNLGDILDRNSAYVDGGWSDYYGYIYVMGNGVLQQSWAGGSPVTWVSSYNMTNETGRTHDTAWDLQNGRYEPGCLINGNLTIGYITGGGTSATDKHNYVTETMYTSGGVGNNPSVSAQQVAVLFGEFKGWAAASAVACLDFATETWTNGGMSWTGTDGHSKGLSTKHGHGYGKNAGNTATTTVSKYSDVTGATINASAATTPNSSGEENFQVGQNWGYCLGHYDGAQNNLTYKQNYLTDSITAMGSDTQPKGHDGMSSAGSASASSMLLGGL